MPPKKAGAQNGNKPYTKAIPIGNGEILRDLSKKRMETWEINRFRWIRRYLPWK